MEQEPDRSRAGETAIAFASALVVVVLLQYVGGAYRSGFGGHPDEAAHFVTALMVRDFLAGLDFAHPWPFAVDYYLHYPKVALGHWPPLLYATAGSWFLVAGASRTTALLFIAIAAAGTCALVYRAGSCLIAPWAGALASLLFVASPLVRESSERFMTEHPVTLAMLASTLSFARFAHTERRTDGAMFGILAALAILTRGSGWALALVPPVTILATWKWHLLWRAGLWLSAVPVVAICVPWYVLTRGMVEGSWTGGMDGVPFWQTALSGFGSILYASFGPVLTGLAAIGILVSIALPWRARKTSPEWGALAGLTIGVLALQCAVPASIEGRFMVTVVPPLVLFMAAGVAALANAVGNTRLRPLASAAISIAALATFGMRAFALPASSENGGVEAVAASVEERVPATTPPVWLVASGSVGEGSLIAAIALREHRPRSYVLRASKLLVKEDWLGRDSQDLYDTPKKLAALLDEIPVGIVVIDDSVPATERRPFHDRLRAQVAGDPAHWAPFGAYATWWRGGRFVPDSVHVFVRRDASPVEPDRARIAALVGNVGSR